MRVLISLALVTVAFAQSNECYAYDDDGNIVYDGDGEPTVVTCMCDASELAQFVRHIGNVCFKDGMIPAEIEEGAYWGCPEDDGNNNNNNNNNGQECDSGENPEAQFWCNCLGSYLNTYDTFPEGCWIPQLSEAMAEIADMTMERAWEENNCHWWDFSKVRVVPEDVE